MDRYRVKPGQKVELSKEDPDESKLFEGGKDEGKQYLLSLNQELEELQELMYAEGKHRLLIILQAMDAGGKDGTVRHVFEGVNPQGVRVASFKVPSKIELAHDYLWRIHKQTPSKGQIVIFNRSHYEDVLVVRVDEIVPEEIWRRRFDQINAFEKMLVQEGTTIIKFFLNIDRDEQKERFQARLDDPTKQWKFSIGDLDKRKQWDDYQVAYQDVLNKTSTKFAPWYVVPANKKWYRNLVIASIVIDTMKDFDMSYPKPEEDLDGIQID